MSSQSQRLPIVCMLLICWVPAHAYIDPGTGSALIQGLIAAVAAVAITIKLYWYRILGFLGLNKNDKDSQSPNTDSDDE